MRKKLHLDGSASCLEELKVADQDRGVHQRDEVRARASGERDGLGEREGEVGGGVFRHPRDCNRGEGAGLTETGMMIKDVAPPPFAESREGKGPA